MKKLFALLMIAIFAGATYIYISAIQNTGSYTAKVISNDKVIHEVNIVSHAQIEKTVQDLKIQFPNADKIEIEEVTDEVFQM